MTIWIAVFVAALAAMLKGADWFLMSAEKIGRYFGLSTFVVGAVIVGLGTSFPELLVAIFAVFEGETEIVAANAVGSNISNILLIIGVAALVGRRLVVSKDLIDLDLPMLAISSSIFVGVIWDRSVLFGEAVILVLSYGVYFAYTLYYKDERIIPKEERKQKKEKITVQTILFLVAGITGLLLGAKYLIDSVIALSTIFDIAPAIISITAVAIGTSLPELIVSVKAALSGKSELAIGNIFGSNSFNALIVVGVPGLFTTLAVDEATFLIGLPVMAAATLLFVISGISKRIHVWEGAMFIIFYIFFIGKLFNLF